MTVDELLAALRAANVRLGVNGERLTIRAPTGALTAELKHWLKHYKADILQLLGNPSDVSGAARITPVSRQPLQPLSYNQRVLWLAEQQHPGTVAYVLPVITRLTGALDQDRLAAAIRAVIRRQEALRTYIQVDPIGEPQAAYHPQSWADQFTLTLASVNGEADAFIRQWCRQPLPLDTSPLFRIELAQLPCKQQPCKQQPEENAAAPRWLLLVAVHHLIADGFSLNVLAREILVHYLEPELGAKSLPPLEVQFADFIHWQNERLDSARWNQCLDFWRGHLHNVPAILDLPLDRPRPAVHQPHGAKLHFQWEGGWITALTRWTQSHQLTPFSVWMAILQVALGRWSGQSRFCVGVPTAGRIEPALEPLIGFFVNATLVRAELGNNPDWVTLARAIQQQMLQLMDFQDMPMQRVIETLATQRDPAFLPWAQVGFQLQDFNHTQPATGITHPQGAVASLQAEAVDVDVADAKFDLILSLSGAAESEATSGTLSGYIEYNTDLFDASTLERLLTQLQTLAQALLQQPELGVENVTLGIPVWSSPVWSSLELPPARRPVRLSTTQLSFWQQLQLTPATRQYSIGLIQPLPKTIDVDHLQRVLQDCVARHPALTASFVPCDVPGLDAVYQGWLADGALPHPDFARLGVVDWPQLLCELGRASERVETSVEVSLQHYFRNWYYQPYDIANDDLIAFECVLGPAGQRWLLLKVHHLILDGTGAMRLLHEVAAAYQGKAERHRVVVDQYEAWVNDHWQRINSAAALEYWRQQDPALSPLQFRGELAPIATARHHETRWLLAEEKVTAWEAACERADLSLPAVFRLMTAHLLSQYCQPEADCLLWEMRADTNPNYHQTIGLMYRQAPVRIPNAAFSANESVLAAYHQLQSSRRQTRPYEQLSLSHFNQLNAAQGLVCQFNYFDFVAPIDWGEAGGGEAAEPDLYGSRIDGGFQVLVQRLRAGLSVEVFSDTTVFNPCCFAERLASLVAQWLSQGAAAHLLWSDLTLLLSTESAWAPSQQRPVSLGAGDQTFFQTFQRQVLVAPTALALEAGSQRWTYAEFEANVAELRQQMLTAGVRAGQRVAICSDVTPFAVMAVWAVIACEAVYIPVDSRYPQERQQFMLTDSQADWIVRQAKSDSAALAAPVAAIVENGPAAPVTPRHINPAQHFYLLYTSGSTGRPKGALVTRAGEANLLQWYLEAGQWQSSSRCLVMSAFGFDLTQKNLLTPLLVGAAVVLPDTTNFDAIALCKLIAHAAVTHINCAPSAFYSVLEAAEDWSLLASLRQVFLGGEAVQLSRLRAWLQHADTRAQLINSYGPTECTDVVAWGVITNQQQGAVPLGQTIPNMRASVRARSGLTLPPQLIGELWLAGPGVGDGYNDRPAETAAQFPHVAGERCYRTGDLGAVRSDGVLTYHGRVDFQLKLRGMRVEPAEIEAAFEQLEAVQQAAALVRDEQLLVFVSSDTTVARWWEAQHWRAAVTMRLPAQWVPAQVVQLASLPLTPNGKVDRNALLTRPLPETRAVYVAPVGPVETQIARVWQSILGRENIGRHDHFYDVGGQSLLANRVVVRLRQESGVSVSIRDLMQYPTVAALAQRFSQLQRSESLPPITPRAAASRVPLTPMQERLWLLQGIDPASSAYHVPLAIRIDGELSVPRLRRALQILLQRHEMLRTAFRREADDAFQVILAATDISIDGLLAVDRVCAQEASVNATANATALTAQAIQAPFELERAPLWRVRAIQLDDDVWWIVLVLHHAITDGWSNALILSALLNAYAVAGERETMITADSQSHTDLNPVTLDYGDFAVWYREHAQHWIAEQTQWWLQRLNDVPPLTLPTDHTRPPLQDFNGARLSFELKAATAAGLQRVARRFHCTPFMLCLALYGIVLGRYSGQRQFCIGTPVNGRVQAETESLVGCFVNTLALPIELEPEQPLNEYLCQLRDQVQTALAYQQVPFESLVTALNPPRDPSRTPVFQVLLIVNDTPSNQLDDLALAASSSGLRISSLALPLTTAKFEQTLSLHWHGGGVSGELNYATALFDASSAQGFVDHWVQLAELVVRADELTPELGMPLASLDFTLAEDHAAHEMEAADTDVALAPLRVEQALAAVNDTFAERPAIRCGARLLTYADVHLTAQRLAAGMRMQAEVAFEPNTSVAVLLPRCPEWLSVILGILTVGARYIPLDPATPQPRLLAALEDSGAQMVVTTADLMERIPAGPWQLATVDNLLTAAVTEIELVPPTADALIYTLFTSGSTGRPKGAQIFHRSILNLMQWYATDVGLGATDKVLVMSPFSFDLTQKNLFTPLWVGAEIIIPPFEEFDPLRLCQLIADTGVTWINCAPSAFYPLIDQPAHWPLLHSLRCVVLGGESLDAVRMRAWWQQHDGLQVINSYGPTECADIAAWHVLTPADFKGASAVPLGRPSRGVGLHVRGAQLQPLPRGAEGELCISGVGVGAGYCQQPQLTAQAFAADPMQPQRRLYRTGDRVRVRADGALVYLGRQDHQLKWRGYRIEAGEIEAALNLHEAVQGCVVGLAQPLNGPPQLTAWIEAIATHDASELTQTVLRAWLSARLPGWMVPDAFVIMATLPLNRHGKVDRGRLPAPLPDRGEQQHLAAVTPLEKQIHAVWSRLLEQDSVSMDAHFFESGGHSLLAARLVAQLQHSLDRAVSVRDLMLAPTIAELAARLEQRPALAGSLTLPSLTPDLPVPLSLPQQRLWLLDQIEGESRAYHIPIIVELSGGLSMARLEAALRALTERHDSLLSAVQRDQDQLTLRLVALPEACLTSEDLTSVAPAEARSAQLQRRLQQVVWQAFELDGDAPLWRAHLIKLDHDRWVFCWTLHHFITDGWSMQLLLKDLVFAYQALAHQTTVVWPEVADSYRAFAVWQRDHFTDAAANADLAYWQDCLADLPPLQMPLDFPRPPRLTHTGASESFTLPAIQVARLRATAQQAGTTLFTAILASYALALKTFSGQADFGIGIPVSGRIDPRLEAIVGFFVNTLVVRMTIDDSESVTPWLRSLHRQLAQSYQHQTVPFEQLVEALAPPRDASRTPLFQTMLAFNQQSQQLPSAATSFGPATSVATGDEELTLQPLESGLVAAKFELLLNVEEASDGCITGSLQYNTDLFSAATVRSLLSVWEHLVGQLAERADVPLAQLSLLPPAQIAELQGWQGPPLAVPAPLTLTSALLEALAAKPQRIAVRSSAEVQQQASTLTAQALLDRSERIAAGLQALGVAGGDRVCWCLPRSLDLPAVVLGILRAGASYVPIDPNYPRSRQQLLLARSGARVLIGAEEQDGGEAQGEAKVVTVAQLMASDATLQPVEVDPSAALYCIFTSGSTGEPKGAEVSHTNALNLLHWYQRQFEMGPADKVLLLSALGFDLSQKNLFAPLLAGAELILAPEHYDPVELTRIIRERAITWINCAPSAFYPLAAVADIAAFAQLRLVMLGGEPIKLNQLPAWFLQDWLQATPPRRELINSYGPTECTDIAAWHAVQWPADQQRLSVPLGRPNDNVKVWIVDPHGRPLPPGAIGQIGISGDGVGLGYVNQPALTTAAFLPAGPLLRQADTSGATQFYATGDRGRWHPAGWLEFLGRIDQQIKLQGYRIEPAEIEAVILDLPDVQACLVDVEDDKLCAWVVAANKAEPLSTSMLQTECRARLPSYMVPGAWALLSQFPLTPNGKIDRRALPSPERSLKGGYSAPESVAQARLCELMASVLEVARVGIDDSFFDLGGQSILAARLMNRIAQDDEWAAHAPIPVRYLFDYPTVRLLAEALSRGAEPDSSRSNQPLRRADPAAYAAGWPLTAGQRRLWLFEQINRGSVANNIPLAVLFHEPLERARLRTALTLLMQRHGALRTVFAEVDGEPVQRLLAPESVEVPLRWHANADAEAVAQAQARVARSAFNLQHGPLFRTEVVCTRTHHGEPQHHFLFCIHHIVADGASLSILMRELALLYRFGDSALQELPKLAVDYVDFAVWQQAATGNEAVNELFWRDQLRSAPAQLQLPTDYPRPRQLDTAGATVTHQFSDAFVGELQQFCRQQQVTPFMALLFAWQLLLSRFSGQDDVLVGVPTQGRATAALESIVGFFIQSLIIRQRFTDNPSATIALSTLKATVLDCFAHADVQFDQLLQTLPQARGAGWNPLVQVAFQLLDETTFDVDDVAQLLPGAEISSLASRSAKFDLTLSLTLRQQRLGATLEYRTALYAAETVKYWLRCFEQLCLGLFKAPDAPVASLALMPATVLLQQARTQWPWAHTVAPLSAMQRDMIMDSLVYPDTLQSSHGWICRVPTAGFCAEQWREVLATVLRQYPWLQARLVFAERATQAPMGEVAHWALPAAGELAEPVLLESMSPAQLTANTGSVERGLQVMIQQPYQVRTQRLLRFGFVAAGADTYVTLACHHALLDGAGLQQVFREIVCAWAQTASSTVTPPSADAYQLAYIERDRQQRDSAACIAYWREQFDRVEALSFGRHSGNTGSDLLRQTVTLAPAEWLELKRLCRQYRVHSSLLLKAVVALGIKLWCQPDGDFLMQETGDERPPSQQAALGCFITETPLLVCADWFKPSATLVSLLQALRTAQRDSKPWRSLSLDAQRRLRPETGVQFMFNYYQFHQDVDWLGAPRHLTEVPSHPGDYVQFVASEQADRLHLHLYCATFGNELAQWLPTVLRLLQQVLAQPEAKLSQLQWIDAAQTAELIALGEGKQRDYRHQYGHDQLVSAILEHCELTPQACAVSDDGEQLSYGELAQQSALLAAHLQVAGVRVGDRVGLYAHRSVRFAVALVATLRAGGVYVPMDAQYPGERIEYMLADAQVALLLTEQALLQRVDINVPTLCLDHAASWQAPSQTWTPPTVTRDDVAYMLYTSGSTGKPKGALITHAGALNHIYGECEDLGFSTDFHFLQTAPASSDISVWQFLGPLVMGGQVTIWQDVTDIPAMISRLQAQQVTLVELVPVVIQLFLEYARAAAAESVALPALRYLMATGEAVSVELVNAWLAHYPAIPVVNAYGPTEAADDVVQATIRAPLPTGLANTPIGQPLPNLNVWIADEQQRLVPRGVVGEICISGVGVGPGYWQQPDKTAAAYVVNPHQQNLPEARQLDGQILYRTGDLGYWQDDGQLACLGRRDHQIKLRGIRIELGEIEAVCSKLPGIRDCAVSVVALPAREREEPALVAFYTRVQSRHEPILATTLREQVRSILPPSWIPSLWVELDVMPQTPAGKIDRARLRIPRDQLESTPTVTELPLTPLETTLAEIWGQFLNRDEVDVTQSFFELGGHSLLAVRMIAHINQRLESTCTLRDLMAAQSVRDFARALLTDAPAPVSLCQPLTRNHDASLPILVLVHAVDGEVLSYRALAQALQADYQVFGLQAPASVVFDGMEADALADLITHYCAALKPIMTMTAGGDNEPMSITLGGHSLGGILALALANELAVTAPDISIKRVLLFDTFAVNSTPQPGTDSVSDSAARIAAVSHELFGADASSEVAVINMTRRGEALTRLVTSWDQALPLCPIQHWTATANPVATLSGDTWHDVPQRFIRHQIAADHQTILQEPAVGLLASAVVQYTHTS